MRQFRLEVENWRTNALPWKDCQNDLTTGEEIHVLEAASVVEELEAAREALDLYCDGENTPCSTEAIARIDKFLEQVKSK